MEPIALTADPLPPLPDFESDESLLPPGASVVVQGGQLNGLSGILVSAGNCGRCTVQIYKNVLLIIAREMLVRAN